MTHEKRMIKSCRETIDAVKEEFHVLNQMHSDDHYFCSILFLYFAHSESQVLCKSRHRRLSGLVVRVPACCAEGGGLNPEWGAQDFQYRLSSAETQQPVDRMRRKARGCLVLSVLC